MSHFRCLRQSVLICGLIFATCFPDSSVVAQENLEEKIEELAQPYIDSGTVVGMSIGVIKDGQMLTVHLGATEKDGPIPNDETVYEIGSISKVFTGVLLADAAATKMVELDEPAQLSLPEGVRMPNWKDTEITLLDLSTHRSGLPRLSDNMPSLNTNNPYSDYTSELAYEFLNDHKLRNKPGGKYDYSNFGVSLLGHLICSLSDKSYEAMLKERISKPLGMKSTGIKLTPSMKKRLAAPHNSSGEQDHNWDFADMPGAGGIRSTISDMLLFANSNLEKPEGETGDALELAWKQHAKGQTPMGLGWHIAGDGSTRWHNGQTGGYHSMMLVNRRLGAASIVLSNTATPEVDQLGEQIIQMLAGQSVTPREFSKEIAVPVDVMKRYEGKYQLAPNFIFTVSVKNEKLMIGITGQQTLRVYPKSETEWFYKVVDASITFKVNKKGKCTALILHQNGMDQTARRKR